MGKVKAMQMAQEMDDMQLESVLSDAANKINKKKPVKSNKKTNINKKENPVFTTKLKPTPDDPKEPVILSRIGWSKDSKPEEPQSEFDDFKKFVNATGTAIKKPDGGTYLKAEAWLYLAKLKGLTPSLDVSPHRDTTGKLLWVDAVCHLLDIDGIEISKSAMMASKSEQFLKGLDDYAVYGMAETRAITRAVRNVYGYVAKGAGFESTPAIEMGLEQDSKD